VAWRSAIRNDDALGLNQNARQRDKDRARLLCASAILEESMTDASVGKFPAFLLLAGQMAKLDFRERDFQSPDFRLSHVLTRTL
jgi:hypothetical protein